MPTLGQLGPITRDGARDAARDELTKPEYRVGEPSLLDRVVNRIVEEVTDLFARAVNILPGGIGGLVLLVLLAVALVVAARLGLGPLRIRDQLTDRRRGARSMTAAEYRAEADRLASAGEWKSAVRAAFRAIVRELEQRGVLDERAGRTAGEIAREAGQAVPGVQAPVQKAAGVFDAVWYGHRAATSADHDVMRAADRDIRTARLTVAGLP